MKFPVYIVYFVVMTVPASYQEIIASTLDAD